MGCSLRQHKLRYCFTEWIEGKNLMDETLGSPINIQIGEISSIAEKVVTSLAEFVYSLTICPIPRTQSKELSQPISHWL